MPDPIPPAARPGGEGTPTEYDAALVGEECACGHEYSRHFDTYDGMAPVGCKYCHCATFTAAVSAPASEPTCAQCGHVHGALTGYCWHQYSNGNRCQCPNTIAARSPAPASGAPGEEDDGSWMAELLDEIRELLTRYLGEEAMTGTAPMFYPEAIRSAMHKAAFGKLPREMYPAGSLLHRAEEAEARLAAAERAGVALREALEGNDAVLEQLRAFLSEITEYEHYYTTVVRFVEALEDNGQRIRAALTPTAPSPDKED